MEKVGHIHGFKIQNFKCFENFEVEGFGKYNIILGDNNVGKTSFLEALLFDSNVSQTIRNFRGLLGFKNILIDFVDVEDNPFVFFINKYSNRKDINLQVDFFDGSQFSYNLEPVTIKEVDESERDRFSKFFNLNKFEEDFLKIEFNNSVEYRKYDYTQNYESTQPFIKYIYSTSYYYNDLVDFYSENFSESRKSKDVLIENLKALIPDISDVEISLNFTKEPLIGIWLKDKDGLLPLPMFGDGAIRLFRIIMEIVISKNDYLCIDEIDTGIHYSKYKDFSRTIIAVSTLNNVQLFLSTHNKEFLTAFKEVLEEEKYMSYQNQTKSFTLKKLPDGNIKAYKYNFEEFEFAIEQENELR